MAASPVNQLNAHISNMLATGLLDEHFTALRRLQDAESPDFVDGLVTNFLNDGDRIFGKLAQLLERPFVDLDVVSNHLMKLKGSSASVGARHVRLACIQLLQLTSQQKNRDEWISTLARGRAAFDEVRREFQTMVQLERQI
ncbi:hypothetical protein EJB05_35358, partial [Eragrostis curvula]